MGSFLVKCTMKLLKFAADHYPETLALVLVTVLSHFFATTYIIYDFNYLLSIFLTASGIVVFHLIRSIAPQRKNQFILILASLFILMIICIVMRVQCIAYFRQHYIDNILSLNEMIRQNKPTQFASYIPFIMLLPPLTFLLMFILYNVSATAALALLFSSVLLISAGGLDSYFQPYNATILWLMVSFTIVTAYLRNMAVTGIDIPRYLIAYSAGISLAVVVFAYIMIGVFGTSSFTDRFAPLRHAMYANIAHISGKRSTGFSDEDMPLDGELFPDERLVMLVAAEHAPYLRGKIRSIYNGRSWRSDTFFRNFVSRSEDEFDASIRSIDIIPKGIRTSYFFIMRHTVAVSSHNDIRVNNDGNLRSADESYIKKKYTVYYDERPLSTGYSLQLYPGLPDRIKQLALKICDDAAAENNGEKIAAIESFLEKNYKYSLSNEPAPANSDFVDHFLFVSKKGYCTAFASAAVILLRCVGVEANYVEGFHITSQRDEEGLFSVTSRMAHAWCETPYGIVDTVAEFDSPRLPIYQYIPYLVEGKAGFNLTMLPSDINEKDKEPGLELPFHLSRILPGPIADFLFAILVNLLPLIAIGFILFKLARVFLRQILFYSPKSILPLFRHIRKKMTRYGIAEEMNKTPKEWLEKMYHYELKRPLGIIIDALYAELYAHRNDTVKRRLLYNQIRYELSHMRRNGLLWKR